MANYYTQTALSLVGTTEELEWLQTLLNVLNSESNESGDIANIADAVRPLGDGGFVGVSSDFYPVGDKGKPMLHLYAEESFNPDLLAGALQAWLCHIGSTKCIGFSWSMTSTRTEAGAFGGGACVVCRDGVDWMSTGQWLLDTVNKHTHKEG